MAEVREPGSAGPELDALVTQLWAPGGDSPVRTTFQRSALPSGYTEVERYALVPSLRRPRFLVPLGSNRAAAASLLRYNGLRPPRTAAVRTAYGAAFRLGAGRVFRDVLRVLIDSDVAPADHPTHLLTARLRQELSAPTLVTGIGVRPLDPNSKPTLQLFDAGGTPLGYAKIGWNDATRRLVETEADVLSDLSPRGFAAPGVLSRGEWAGRRFVVTAPLPAGIDRHRNPDVPPSPAFLADLLGPAPLVPLQESAYWRRAGEELDSMRRAGDAGDLPGALAAYVSAVANRWGAERFRFGRWHGDWVPWNLGWHAGHLHVWDWEHSTGDAITGLDQAHWHFQVAFVLRGAALDEALRAVRSACAGGWPEIGVSPPAGAAVADLYLVELALRTYRLRAGGGGWNAGLYPALLPALAAAAAGLARTSDPAGGHRSERTRAFQRHLGETA